MKRMFFLAALAVALAGSLTPAQACGRTRGGPIRHAIRHAADAKPMRTVVGRVLDAPARIVEARPVASFVQAVAQGTAIGGCPSGRCPGR